MKNILIISITTLLFTFIPMKASITLPALIADNMVLQQNQKVAIWGWTTLNDEKIKVCGSWNDDSISVVSKEGKWKVFLQTPKFGGPYTVCIKGIESKTIQNVMIGEVWLASGQSNMAMTVDSMNKNIRGVTNRIQKIAEANYPTIRMFTVQHKLDSIPQDNCEGDWQICNPENVRKFSATAYFFAKTLVDSMHVPVGIINSSWGGSEAESWLKKELITNNERLYKGYKKLIGKKLAATAPGLKYNAMIYPLENYVIKGAIWYQGERNKPNANVYTELMTNLITSWRAARYTDFPFYLVQIVPLSQKNISTTFLRDAQRQILTVAKTGMVVTSDFSDITNLHPPQKEEVGRRLALWALSKDYGKKLVCSGPLYKSMKVKGSKIIVSFDYAQGGLMVKGGTLNNFEIAGNDHLYLKAEAEIIGSKVLVFSNKIKEPVAVRYAFSDDAQSQIYNKAGLPASIFRTDTLSCSASTKNN